MKQASSDLVDELISMKFVQEMKSTQQRVGKPPTRLKMSPPPLPEISCSTVSAAAYGDSDLKGQE